MDVSLQRNVAVEALDVVQGVVGQICRERRRRRREERGGMTRWVKAGEGASALIPRYAGLTLEPFCETNGTYLDTKPALGAA